ncbi:hypothetical protein IMCC14465_18610 [alpha proteobacterium IMCC14465]|uniref:SnoaL-like domain-containing protein n=1 Tax=alpha proteobacterium IMCC14465 TaxID=1220535 RepID=J9A210_9PROT|nr:hypothetical protein IMCC14465_18610 [alpha proteobacterium IMCC14465]
MSENMNSVVSDILGSEGDGLADDIMVSAVENYVKHFNNGDYEGVANLYAETATVEDPIGTPIKNGKDEIREFYKMSTQLGAKLALSGPVRVVANRAAFAFSVTTQSPQGNVQVDVIDTFKFDAEGKVTEMCAYWGQSNVKM